MQVEQQAIASARDGIAMQGDIGLIALDNIFQLLDFAALSGRLEVHAPGNSGFFSFNNGLLTNGMLQMNHRRIGEILLESRIITEDKLQECLLLHEQGGAQQRFGQILLEKGYVQADRLDESLLRQIKEAFFETLSWTEGTFVFYQNQTVPLSDTDLQARVDQLLLEGMISIDHAESANM